MKLRCLALLALLSAPFCAALGQEMHLLAGAQYTPSAKEKTYAYSIEYLENLGDSAYGTFTWLNEGHVTNHHRDGYSAQLWWRWLTASRRFTLSAGLGPYRYYDTTYVPDVGVTDAHGWGALGSVAIHWYFRNPWVAELRYNDAYSHHSDSITTHSVLVGLGYQFERSRASGPVWDTERYDFYPPMNRWEFTVLAGGTVVNNFNSPQGVAWGAELRYRLTPYVDAIATYLDEGDARVVNRQGAAGQLGLKREFLDHRADVGVAGGFYIARDREYTSPATQVLGLITTRSQVLGLLTMTASYRMDSGFRARGSWYRTLTTNGRDTDVAMLGLGRAF